MRPKWFHFCSHRDKLCCFFLAYSKTFALKEFLSFWILYDAVLNTFVSQLAGSGFKPVARLDSVYVVPVSGLVSYRYSGFLQYPRALQIRLICVIKSMNGSVCLCVL